MLQAEEVIVNIGVANTLGEDNTSQERGLRVAGGPTRQVAHGLSANTLSGISRWTTESWWGATRAAKRAGGVAGGRAINDGRVAAIQRLTIRQVERVERRIPSRIGKWVVKCGFVGDAESAAERSLAAADDVPGEPKARTEVVVVAPA